MLVSIIFDVAKAQRFRFHIVVIVTVASHLGNIKTDELDRFCVYLKEAL